MSPVKPVSDYLEDLTTLQGAVASYGSEVLVQKRTFAFSGLCGFESVDGLAQALKSQTAVQFDVIPSDAMWDDMWRIRMSRVRSVA